VSELDENGVMLRSFTDVNRPRYLSVDSRGNILVADYLNRHILLLNSELCLERLLIDGNSLDQLSCPVRLYFNELTSQLYVIQWYDENGNINSILSHFSLQWLTNSWPWAPMNVSAWVLFLGNL